MPRSARFSIVTPLPPHGEWRRALALDSSGPVPHAVVLSFVPQAVLDDPPRLQAVVRDAEAAGRLHHPSAVPVLGTETIDDELAIVEAHWSGTTLRALLDAGGRLPPDVAARIVVDACAAVNRAHALDVADGKKLVHGAIAPSRIAVAEDGAALVLGFGTGVAATPEDDVRALASVLHECLAGEPPSQPPASLEAAGVSSALASAVGRVLAAPPDAPPSAASLAQAVAAAGPIASHADVAAYVDAIVPPGEGARAEVARALAAATSGDAEEVTEDYIVEPTEPTVRAPPRAERPVSGAEAAPPRAAAPPAAAPRPAAPSPAAPATASPAAAAPPSAAPPPAAWPTARAAEPTPEPLPRPPATRPGIDPAGVFAAPPPPPRRSRAPALVAAICAAIGFAAGFAAARLTSGAALPWRPAATATAPAPLPAAVPAAAVPGEPAPAKAKEAAAPRPARRAEATKPRPAPPRRAVPVAGKPAEKQAAAGKGVLHVAAPADAEVFLDDQRIGSGTLRVEIPEGVHRIEVRRGQARVAERFSLAAGETWTYDVTPTP